MHAYAIEGRTLSPRTGIGILALSMALAMVALPPAARSDTLYTALLDSKPAALPAGVGLAKVGPGPIDQEDRNAGMLGNVQVDLTGPDPAGHFNYLVFPNTVAANAYLARFDRVIARTGATRRVLPYLPRAQCASTPNGAVCAAEVDRVLVFSVGSKVDGSAAPLLQAGLNHLKTVKKAAGIP